jgi:hypothetical protein
MPLAIFCPTSTPSLLYEKETLQFSLSDYKQIKREVPIFFGMKGVNDVNNQYFLIDM